MKTKLTMLSKLTVAGLIGVTVVDKYHDLMHLIWGALAFGASFLGLTISKRFCIGSGVFYLALAILGLLIGNPSTNRAWYLGPMLLNTGDHIFHLVLGSLFLGVGLVSGRQWMPRHVQLSGN